MILKFSQDAESDLKSKKVSTPLSPQSSQGVSILRGGGVTDRYRSTAATSAIPGLRPPSGGQHEGGQPPEYFTCAAPHSSQLRA